MSFIQFESGSAKEKARKDLKDAREELLKNARTKYMNREQDELKKKFRGDDQWMLPSISQKIDKQAEKVSSKSDRRSKKEKKSKKKKKEKKHKKRKESSDSESSEEELVTKKTRKRHYSSDSDEWVEKDNANNLTQRSAPEKAIAQDNAAPLQRDNWMSGILIPTYSKSVAPKKEAERSSIDKYNPSTSTRELNPFWKNGGSGLPTFKKPTNDSDDESDRPNVFRKQTASLGNWRKDKTLKHDDRSRSRDVATVTHASQSHFQEAIESKSRHRSSSGSSSEKEEAVVEAETSNSLTADFLTDQQMNEMAAKIIKAEIMDDHEVVQKLRNRLDNARKYRDSHMNDVRKKAPQGRNKKEDDGKILLTTTSENGLSKPLQRHSAVKYQKDDPWGGRSSKKKQPKVQTHAAGERVRYFADDDKYDIKEMFENEKFSSGRDQEEQFIDIAGRHKNPNDDLEDIFSEQIVKGISENDLDEKNKNRSIHQHRKMQEALDSCDKCFGSAKMDKKLIVCMGSNVYLSLPWHEGLQSGHCMIVPMQHISCSTQLDEDVWTEVVDFQKSLTSMFRSRSEDVIFFETVRYLHKLPHMTIHCVPSKHFELAPFYFKKAIQESEREWSTNKQLVSLKEKDLRRSIPKGLPYFWVNFGTEQGFAHVIEEQDRFPNNFAQEIIGGLLNLDVRKWKRPRVEQNPIPKVKQFADWWKPFDITVTEQ